MLFNAFLYKIEKHNAKTQFCIKIVGKKIVMVFCE